MPYDILSATKNLFTCLDVYPWNLEVNELEKGLNGQTEIFVSYRSILKSQSRTCYRVWETMKFKVLSIDSEFPKHIA